MQLSYSPLEAKIEEMEENDSPNVTFELLKRVPSKTPGSNFGAKVFLQP
jgi:hypothetical protein